MFHQCISAHYSGDAKPPPAAAGGEDSGCAATYLRCPATFTISGLKKLIQAKYDLSTEYLVGSLHSLEKLI